MFANILVLWHPLELSVVTQVHDTSAASYSVRKLSESDSVEKESSDRLRSLQAELKYLMSVTYSLLPSMPRGSSDLMLHSSSSNHSIANDRVRQSSDSAQLGTPKGASCTGNAIKASLEYAAHDLKFAKFNVDGTLGEPEHSNVVVGYGPSGTRSINDMKKLRLPNTVPREVRALA